MAQRNNDANIISNLNGVNPVAPYPNPQIDENIIRERDLTSFEIYRDGVSLVTLDSDVFSYRDEDVVNMTEYCYSLRSVYDEGVSEFSEEICEIPNPGPAASNLTATD